MKQKMKGSAIVVALFFLVSIVIITASAFAQDWGQQQFREADNLNYGGVLGPLLDGTGPTPIFRSQDIDQPRARDIGFGSDNDRYTPINKKPPE